MKILKFKKQSNCESSKGFTLIELLLYISLAASILLLTSVFLVGLLQSRVKNQAIAEVEQQGLQVMQMITQTVRNAGNIISPSIGGTASSLEIDVMLNENNPTIFDASGGLLRISEGGGDPIALTNSRVLVSGLNFKNLSRANTPGTVRIQFTLSHINPENRNEYSYKKTFIGSATLRQP